MYWCQVGRLAKLCHVDAICEPATHKEILFHSSHATDVVIFECGSSMFQISACATLMHAG